MAFPASQQLLVNGLRSAQVIATQLKTRTQTLKGEAETTPVDRMVLINYMGQISSALTEWAEVSALPGIAQYARDQFDNQVLDIGAEFLAMTGAATNLRDWLFNAFPTDPGTGAWLVNAYGNDGKEQPLQFTAAQLTGFVTRADALIATIG